MVQTIPLRIKKFFSRFSSDDGADDVQNNLVSAYNEAAEESPDEELKEVRSSVKKPLGERLDFQRIRINEPGVMAMAKKEMGDDFAAPAPPHDVIQGFLEDELKRVARNFKIDPAEVNLHTVAGKNHLGWFLGKDGGKSTFELGSDSWRIPDWLSPPVEEKLICATKDLTILDEGEDLGDGVVAVVTPEMVGLEPGTTDHIQMRAVVRDHRQVITRIFKGIVMVHPNAKNVIAWEDGYGDAKVDPLDSRFILNVFPMTWGWNANFRSRYTEQGMSYQGVPGWEKRFFSLSNLHMAVGDEHDRDIDRLMKSNSPVNALGGFGFVAFGSRLMQRSAYAGISRMALPAKAFKYIAGLEYVAEIEDTLAEGDKEYGIPYYYAPQDQLKRYTAFKDKLGRIRRVLNRRPDLSTGQCTRSHQLKGGTPFNAIVVPTWSMLLSGLDFDGDAIVDMPHPAQGGLYVPFNELPAAERTKRLAKATADRKGGGAKTPYGSTLERWAGQLEAKVILGAADLGARRFLDMNEDDLAYSLQAWVQAAVDRQKRPVEWPHSAGPALMVSAPYKDAGGKKIIYLTDILRDVTKSIDADASSSDYRKAVSNIEARMLAVQKGTQMACRDWKNHPRFMFRNESIAEYALRWCMETDWRLDSAQMQISTRFDRREQMDVMVPFEGRYPVRQADDLEEIPAHLAKLVKTAQILDEHWSTVIRAYDQKTTRQGAFAVKDGLLNALRNISDRTQSNEVRELVAGQVTNYNLFRELATPEQLKTYFRLHAGSKLRISDLTCLNTSDMWERRTSNEGMSMRNLEPMWIGFEKFEAGQLRLSRRRGDNGVVIRVKGKRGLEAPIPTNCRVVGDALLELRAHLGDHYDRFEEIAKRLEVPVQPANRPAAPVRSAPSAPAAKGEKAGSSSNGSESFQVKGEELFRAALST